MAMLAQGLLVPEFGGQRSVNSLTLKPRVGTLKVQSSVNSLDTQALYRHTQGTVSVGPLKPVDRELRGIGEPQCQKGHRVNTAHTNQIKQFSKGTRF